MQTHLEPLAEAADGRRGRARPTRRASRARIVARRHGQAAARAPLPAAPTTGSSRYLTLGLDGTTPLAEAHARASEIEERIRREQPEIAEVIVHTEP